MSWTLVDVMCCVQSFPTRSVELITADSDGDTALMLARSPRVGELSCQYEATLDASASWLMCGSNHPADAVGRVHETSILKCVCRVGVLIGSLDHRPADNSAFELFLWVSSSRTAHSTAEAFDASSPLGASLQRTMVVVKSTVHASDSC